MSSELLAMSRRDISHRVCIYEYETRRVSQKSHFTPLMESHHPGTERIDLHRVQDMAQAESSSAAANRSLKATANGSSAAYDLPW